MANTTERKNKRVHGSQAKKPRMTLEITIQIFYGQWAQASCPSLTDSDELQHKKS
jgi:hypothetical protein